MLLLEHKADINVRNLDGDTPLILAAWNDEMTIVQILVQALCDITIRGEKERTAAEWAKLKGHHDIAEYLNKRAPDVQVQ